MIFSVICGTGHNLHRKLHELHDLPMICGLLQRDEHELDHLHIFVMICGTAIPGVTFLVSLVGGIKILELASEEDEAIEDALVASAASSISVQS